MIDKGNNSAANINGLEDAGYYFIGRLKPSSYEDLLSKPLSDFKDKYDELWKQVEAKEISIEDMKQHLAELDEVLKSKYPMYKEVPMPKSGKQWKEFIMEMGTPVTLAITQETEELAIFLMDAQYE